MQANAEHFGPELPFIEGGSKRVLYPASNKASTELQVGAGELVLSALIRCKLRFTTECPNSAQHPAMQSA